MSRFLALFKLFAYIALFFSITIHAEPLSVEPIENTQAQSTPQEEKVLYLSFDEAPSSVLKGSIFKVTLKVLPSIKNLKDIEYEFSNATNIKALTPKPQRKSDYKYIYDTFYFAATSSNARLPDITAIPIDKDNKEHKESTLLGINMEVIPLNPKKDFSNIVADSFDLVEYKTTNFDNENNIVVFVASAKGCDIASIKLGGVAKQGIESISESPLDSRITYYAVINKNLETFTFSYFNIVKNKFIDVNIPIVVNDDSVTTQSDLKPVDQSHQKIKFFVALIAAIFAIIMVIIKKNYKYLIIMVIPIGYILLTESPTKEVCIKANSNIYLLPMNNGTVFEKTDKAYNLQKEGERKGWVKIQLENQKIGWVRDEDLCSN